MSTFREALCVQNRESTSSWSGFGRQLLGGDFFVNAEMKLLLLCEYYPPVQRIPSRRMDALVTSLTMQGHEIVVATPRGHGAGVTIGLNREVIIPVGVSSNKHTEKIVSNRHISFQLRLISWIKPSIVDSTVSRWWCQVTHSKKIKSAAEKADIIFASYGPAGPIWAAKRLSKITGTPFVVDIRDTIESRQLRRGGSLKRSIDNRIEKWLLSVASDIITVSTDLKTYLSEKYHRHVECVYNGWSEADLLNNWQPRHSSKYLYYAGTVYQHRLDALAILLQALRNHRNLKLRVRLLNSDHNAIRTLIEKTEVADQVDVLSPVDNNVVNQESRNAAGLVVLEALRNDNPWRTGTITGKLFGLLASGVPGLVVAHKSIEASRLAALAEGWYRVDSVEECEKAIVSLLNVSAPLDNARRLSDYHFSNQFSGLVRRLDQLVGRA